MSLIHTSGDRTGQQRTAGQLPVLSRMYFSAVCLSLCSRDKTGFRQTFLSVGGGLYLTLDGSFCHHMNDGLTLVHSPDLFLVKHLKKNTQLKSCTMRSQVSIKLGCSVFVLQFQSLNKFDYRILYSLYMES